jgi:hypothetical protein
MIKIIFALSRSRIKIRNPNIEIRNKGKALNPNYEIRNGLVWNFVLLGHLDLFRISSFEFFFASHFFAFFAVNPSWYFG